MPWNFPFWQVIRFAAPALMAGNVGLLKHAHNVPQCALALEELFLRAGFPQGAFQTLLIETGDIARVIEDPRVKAVTLTGSEGAGRAVGGQAGRALKKVVLELGGSDPFIVMPSAKLDAAVETAVKARLINNGQSCIAAKRFIVHEAIYPEFERRFVERMGRAVVGDPMDSKTEVGPLATESIRQGLHAQVEKSVSAGAKLLRGRQAAPGAGALLPAHGDRRSAAGLSGRDRGAVRPGGRALQGEGRASTPSSWPMTAPTAWAPACGRMTRRRRASSSTASRRAWSSSTRWWPRMRGCRSAE